LLEKRDELQLTIEEQTAKVAAIKQRQQDEEPEARKMQAYVDELGHELRLLHKTGVELHKKLEAKKAEAAGVEEQINRVQLATTAAQQDIAKLTSQIVRSPDRMKKEISDMSLALASEKQSVIDTERRSRELTAKADLLQKTDKV